MECQQRTSTPSCKRSFRSGRDLETRYLAQAKRTSRVNKIHARQSVLHCDFLRTKVLLYRDREVGAALVHVVVREDHDFLMLDLPYASDDVSCWDPFIMACKLANLEERRSSVDKTVYSFHWIVLSFLQHLLFLSLGNQMGLFNETVQFAIQLLHRICVFKVLL